jgi:nickel/cobalt transporter (NicO) family protein
VVLGASHAALPRHGKTLLAWLGVTSGLLIATIGAALLRPQLRRRVIVLPAEEPALVSSAVGHGHGHGHGHGAGHGHAAGPVEARSRASLVAMGVAGGLVPSPSALVVLLGAIGLGRTFFGILLVFCYGLGMAATLTAVGLLLVRLRDRIDVDRFSGVSRWTPAVTAALVLVVGLALAARAAGQLVRPF